MPQKPAQSVGSRPYLDNIAESDRKMLQDVLKGSFVRYIILMGIISVISIQAISCLSDMNVVLA